MAVLNWIQQLKEDVFDWTITRGVDSFFKVDEVKIRPGREPEIGSVLTTVGLLVFVREEAKLESH